MAQKQVTLRPGVGGGTSRSIHRRLADSRFATRYFRGAGIDIGGGEDSLILYAEFFPLMRSIRLWDLEDGDAQKLAGIPDESYDFAYSSHCLEHLENPTDGLDNWLRVVKPGGHLIVDVPDEDLYEQGQFPSTFNSDHKWTFTIAKMQSWSPKSINVMDLLRPLADRVKILKIELLDHGYRRKLPRFDQTLTPAAESSIEFILQKN